MTIANMIKMTFSSAGLLYTQVPQKPLDWIENHDSPQKMLETIQ